MATPLITTLIDKKDNAEIVRDEIAAIIKLESQNQMALAPAGGLDPKLFDLKVFTERHYGWQLFLNTDGKPVPDVPPVVNVWWEQASTDPSKSDLIERQKEDGQFNIDCIGYGVARKDGTGQQLSDQQAAFASQRAIRLCRNILMADVYVSLNMEDVVWDRMVTNIEAFQPTLDDRAIPEVYAMRMTLTVGFNEFSPQYVAEALELVSVQALRRETGEIYFELEYDETPPP